jgi:hypothetical protein
MNFRIKKKPMLVWDPLPKEVDQWVVQKKVLYVYWKDVKGFNSHLEALGFYKAVL